MNENDVANNIVFRKYKDSIHRIMPYLLPTVSHDELENAINYSINKRFKNADCMINNNYKEKTANTNLLKLTEYIISRKPIITSYGCLFTQHGEVPNPLEKLIGEFASIRNGFKKEMLKYPKGSELFNKYNLLQVVAKVDTNAIYGCLGAASSIFYNIYVATSITRQGRCSISSSIMVFESFLANNIKFGSLDEIISFIDNVMSEVHTRTFKDSDFLDNPISPEQVFTKLMMTCGYFWLPSMEDCEIVWQIVNRLPQEELNRIYYKNNLFDFFENSKIKNMLIDMLNSLDAPFLDPNHPPKTIEDKLNFLYDLLKEYVYYQYQYIDKIERVERMIRKIDLITDTDSCIISLDPWYHYVLDMVKDIDMPIKHMELDVNNVLDAMDINKIESHRGDMEEYYDFHNDRVIERKRLINPLVVIPEDSLRYSIINILAYCIGKLVNHYMRRLSIITNTINDKHPDCLLTMKNEFLFKRILLTKVKKNYVTFQEIQEGNKVPLNKGLDIKGLAMNKSGVPDSTTKALSKILYEDILNCDEVNQLQVLNKLALLERRIYDAIHNGSIEYFKPARIKTMESYKTPMQNQGIKASVVYNDLKDDNEPAINLEEKNAILIIKTNITLKNIEDSNLKKLYQDKYEKAVKLMNSEFYKDGIKSIAIPYDLPIPKWLLEFIDYTQIIRDNIGTFPLEPLGFSLQNTKSAYSGILKL